jgi:hypothetical protein
MKDCRELSPLLVERAAGPLPPAGEARVAAHLEGCETCRGEARALALALDLVRVPAAGAEEERGAASLPGRVLAAARRPARTPVLRWAVPAAAAAGAAMAFLVPAALHRTNHAPATVAQAVRGTQAADAAEAAALAWEEPDETLWDWTAALSEADADGYADDETADY